MSYFGILGGMGTIATTNFLQEMNRHYHPDQDQDYLDYVLVNAASVPDRTEYILGKSTESPLPKLIEGLDRLNKFGVDFVSMPCNTAHYFYQDLSEASEAPLLNMIDLVGRALEDYRGEKVGIAGTCGTLMSGLYSNAAESHGVDLVYPDDELEDAIMDLIYKDVKAGLVNLDHYYEILRAFEKKGAKAVILGCTEISYANSRDTKKPFPVIDAEKLLVDETIRLGRKSQGK